MSRFTAVAAVLLVCLVVAQAAVSRVKLVNPGKAKAKILELFREYPFLGW